MVNSRAAGIVGIVATAIMIAAYGVELSLRPVAAAAHVVAIAAYACALANAVRASRAQKPDAAVGVAGYGLLVLFFGLTALGATIHEPRWYDAFVVAGAATMIAYELTEARAAGLAACGLMVAYYATSALARSRFEPDGLERVEALARMPMAASYAAQLAVIATRPPEEDPKLD